MSFLLGLFIGMGLSSKRTGSNTGGVRFMTMEEIEEHLKNPPPNPFDTQDNFKQSTQPASDGWHGVEKKNDR
jgi:hypothetical protein